MQKIKILLALSILFLFVAACSLTQTPDTKIEASQESPTQIPLPLTEAEVPRVTVEEAKTALDDGTAIFVDVRSKQLYEAGHIPGASLILLGEFESRPEKLKLPKDQWIITYCS